MMPFYLTSTCFPPLPTALMTAGGGGLFCCRRAGDLLLPGVSCLVPVFLFATVDQVNGAVGHRAVELHVVGDGGLHVRVCEPCGRRPGPVNVKDDAAYGFAYAVD